MPHPGRHHLALFSLYPLNDYARKVVNHPHNSHLTATLLVENSLHLVLDVDFNPRSKSRNTLATLGRGDTDIIVEGDKIARLQCSFEISLDSGVVMLYDRSNGQTTQVVGDNAIPFEHGRVRRAVVQKGLNTIIGMGGSRCDLVQFKLIWHDNDPLQMMKDIKSQAGDLYRTQENPRLARTPPLSPSTTGTHAPGQQRPRIRYAEIGDRPLGSGQFGTVHKCVNVDSGELMAIKILKHRPGGPQGPWREKLQDRLKREVEVLSAVSHPHIVDFIASQGWDTHGKVEIFMGLKEGTLQSLMQSWKGPPKPVVKRVFPQMLEALDCLAHNGIVHRDIKPENILYTTISEGQYQFQLGDFGLCNRVIDAVSDAGSHIYMAPEIFWRGTQTPKLDVWSLFVTMLWTLNVKDFRRRANQFGSIDELQEAVLNATSDADMSTIQEMAIVNPEERASAAQMLVKQYKGVGLTTPRNRIPALVYRPSAITTPRAPADLTTQATPMVTNPRGFQGSENISATAGR